jgi:hypothetical protein
MCELSAVTHELSIELAAVRYLDWAGVLSNALGTIIGGVFLTIFYFAVAEKLLRLPQLSGTWILETTAADTNYNPFRGMVLRYKVLLLQDRTSIQGTAEKVYEKSDKERVFTGTNRTRASINGVIRKAYLSRSALLLHVTEQGFERPFSWVVRARCLCFGTRTYLIGVFSSSAGDTSGTLILRRIPLPNRVDEYRGIPLRWFGRTIEFLTAKTYRQQWNDIKMKLLHLEGVGRSFWKENNCHLLVAALVLAEDRRFYRHGGTDPIALCRAFVNTAFKARIQGGSTIEQQLVRVLTADHRRSVRRKLKEIALAVRLHTLLRKDQIAVAYLLSAYFGWHMNGIREAAQRFSVNLSDPNPAEAARLISRIRYPEPSNPPARQTVLAAAREDWINRELRARPYLLY